MIFLYQYRLDESVYVHSDSPECSSSRKIISAYTWHNHSNVDVAIRTGATLAVRSEQVHLRRADGINHGTFVSFGDVYCRLLIYVETSVYVDLSPFGQLYYLLKKRGNFLWLPYLRGAVISFIRCKPRLPYEHYLPETFQVSIFLTSPL